MRVLRVIRWTSPTAHTEYALNIPVFDDDTVGRVVTKIALSVKDVDVSTPPYIWDSKGSIAFAVSPAPSSPNPWEVEEKEKEKEKERLPHTFKQTLFSDAMWGKRSYVNVVFVNDVPEHIRKNPAFFPDYGRGKAWVIGDTYKKVLQESNKLNDIWTAGALPEGSVTHMYSKLTFTAQTKDTLDMAAAIEKLRAASGTRSGAPQFLQFILDSTKILYKVAQQHTLPSTLVKDLVAYERLPKIQGIVAIFPFGRHVYARTVLDVSGKVSIYYKIAKGIKTAWEDIVNYNRIIQAWVTLALGRKAPAFSVTSMAVRTYVRSAKKGINEFRRGASANGQAIFHPEQKGNNIIFIRSVNYKSKLDIIDNIKSQVQSGIPEDEIRENLMSSTGMSADEATDYIAQYNTTVQSEMLLQLPVKRKPYMLAGCLFRINQVGDGYHLIFENIGSPDELDRAVRWINGVIETMKIAAKGKPQPVVEERPKSSSSSQGEPLRDIDGSEDLSFASTSSSGGGKDDGYFVRMLELADPSVFQISRKDKKGKKESYARLCGANNFRQPIVRNNAEMEQIKKDGYGDAFDDSIEYRNHHYFCPRIWCPKAMIPVKPSQLVKNASGKDVCPGKFGEDPMYLYNEDVYWKKDPNIPHHIGFLDKKKSDEGFCLPCCMKKPLVGNKAPAARARLQSCLAGKQDSVSASVTAPPKKQTVAVASSVASSSAPAPIKAKAESAPIDDTNFILSARAPIPAGRYGTVPDDLHNTVYPSVPLQTCLMNLTTTPCLVRLGIEHKDDSFLQAIAVALGKPNKEEFISWIVKKKLDPITFWSLDNGNILQAFLPVTSTVTAGEIKEMQSWHQRFPNPMYIKTTRATHQHTLAFKAYIAFIQYLRSSDPKPVWYMIELMKGLGYTLVVIDYLGEVYCPRGLRDNVIMICKDGDFYEPIVGKTRSVAPKLAFNKDTPEMHRFFDVLQGLCPDIINEQRVIMSFKGLALWIDDLLLAKGKLGVQDIILLPDLKIHGFRTYGGVIIHRQGGMSITFLPQLCDLYKPKKILFMEDLVGVRLPVTSIPSIDLSLLRTKLTSLGLAIDESFTQDKTPLSGYVQGFYEISPSSMYDLAYPAIRVSNRHTNIGAEDVKWHSTKMTILKMLIDHYDTLVASSRSKSLEALMRRFVKITGDNVERQKRVYNILEQMPIWEGRDALVRWRRMDFTDARWTSSFIRSERKQWVFTQVAVQDGLPEWIYTPRAGPIPDPLYAPRGREGEGDEKNKEKEKDIARAQKPSAPPFLIARGDKEFEQLPSKWRNKAFSTSRVIDKAIVIADIVAWLSTMTSIPLTYGEVEYSRRRHIKDLTKDERELKLLMGDASVATFFKDYSKLKSVDEVIRLVMSGKVDVREMLDTHRRALQVCDIDWQVISLLLDITVLMIRSRVKERGAGEGAKRGDNADLLTSSSLYAAKEWKTRPVILIYKDTPATAKHSTYKAIVDAKGTFFHPMGATLPKKLQETIEFLHE